MEYPNSFSIAIREHSERTQKKLEAVEDDDPRTWGGVLEKKIIVNTMPDVQPNTKVLAICGITDLEMASPQVDGWFFSDFFLFNHLLKGTVKDQTWIAAKETSPEALLGKYVSQFGPSPFLHGNPYGTRKVVLDEEILKSRSLTPITLVGKKQLLPTFLSELKRKSQEAQLDNSPVLVLIFAHGQIGTSYVELGPLFDEQNERQIQLLTLEDFSASTVPGVPVTVLSTAAYSGGCSVSPDLNITTLAAADFDWCGESWHGSKSLSRRCGSIFATALQRVIIEETEPSFMEHDEDNTFPKEPIYEHMKTYVDFTSAVFNSLNSELDRFGGMRYFKFSAQNDDWDLRWTTRTGFPLHRYKTNWDRLRDYAPSPQLPPEVFVADDRHREDVDDDDKHR